MSRRRREEGSGFAGGEVCREGGETTRERLQYACQECGTSSPRWMGRCPGCGSFNTMVEERITPEGTSHRPQADTAQPVALVDVRVDETARLATGSAEMDRVLGGGLVPGGLVLVGGDPGVGKSTLMLQAAAHLSQQGPVLYVTAEESVAQTRIRAERLHASSQQLFLLAEGALHAVEEAYRARDWKLVVVDSLQTVYDSTLESAPGSVSQVREVASRVMRLAKSSGTPTFLVGHVNKEGSKRPPALGNQAA